MRTRSFSRPLLAVCIERSVNLIDHSTWSSFLRPCAGRRDPLLWMNSRTRSRKPASIGSNHSSRKPAAISASEPRTGNFVLLLVMAWSPPAHNAGIIWVSAPGDYATFNSNHTPDGTDKEVTQL